MLDIESVFDEDTSDTLASTPDSTEAETETVEADEDTNVDDVESADAEDEAEDEEEELEFIELDGEEVTLDQIRELKKSGLREQDYTKKTQAVAEERKSVEAKAKSLDDALATLEAAETEIKALLVADLEDVDMDELKKSDYTEYQRMKELKSEREGKLDEIKAKAAKLTSESMAKEREAMVEGLGWSDKSKEKADREALNAYLKDSGFSDSDMRTIKSAKVMMALVELAKIKNAPKTAEKKKSKVKVIKSSKSLASKSSSKSNETLEDIVFGE